MSKVTTMNTSGIKPLDLRVLVRPDEARRTTAGGIHLPDSVVEQDEHAADKGTLVAIGENAWCEASGARGFLPLEPGARVLFAKYAGRTTTGADGVKYRIMNDEDIVARLED